MTTIPESIVTSNPDEDHSSAQHDAVLRRAPRITQADVFRVADALLIEGHRPTIDRVRMRLGRGSPNTINDHLDAWWTKLGSRLRDLPGQEFPQLPERVAHSLQNLWNTALEGAHEALQGAIQEREEALRQAEQSLTASLEAFNARTESVNARAAAIEDSLALTREQLGAAIQRAESLEHTGRERDALLAQARTHAEAAEAASADLRLQLTGIEVAHREERARLEDRYTAAESRWLQEVDRARQAVKDSERASKALLAQVTQLTAERDHARLELTQVRGELRTAQALRVQWEAAQAPAPRSPKKRKPLSRTSRRGTLALRQKPR